MPAAAAALSPRTDLAYTGNSLPAPGSARSRRVAALPAEHSMLSSGTVRADEPGTGYFSACLSSAAQRSSCSMSLSTRSRRPRRRRVLSAMAAGPQGVSSTGTV